MSNKKWEYKEVYTLDYVNRYALQGWKLINAFPSSYALDRDYRKNGGQDYFGQIGLIYILEREIKEVGND